MKMKKIGPPFALAALLAAGVLLFSNFGASKARAAGGFSNASIQGTYAYAAEGFAEVNPDPSLVFGPVTSDYAPFAAAGFIIFDGTTAADGTGGMHIHDTVYIQGAIRHRNFDGTYSINPDGSGVLTFLSFGGTPKTRELFVTKSKQEIKYVVTDNPDDGAVNAGTLVKQSD